MAVAVLVVSLLLPFVDQDYSANYQFDTHVFATHVAGFRQALATLDLRHLPPLRPWPAYLDAYDVLLTALSAGTAGAGHYLPAVAEWLPTVEIQTHFWARWLSVAFHAVGMTFLFLALMRVYARPLVAFGLTMLVAAAPTVIDMDVGRNDWGVLGSLCAVLYFNICLAQGEYRKRTLVGLGVSAALLLTMKVNGPAFAVFLAFPLLMMLLNRRASARRLSLLLGTFAAATLILLLRQIYYSADFVSNLSAQLMELKEWSVKSPKPSPLFYSWDILQSQGRMYRLLVWASVPVVLTALWARRSQAVLFVLGSFGFFLAWSVVIDYGFSRGGYHLLPLFVLMIATAFAFLEDALRGAIPHPRLAEVTARLSLIALLVEPVAAVAHNYVVQATVVFNRPAAVLVTRTLPAQWMAQTFPAGTRVATLFGPERSFLPPIFDLGFAFDQSLFSRPSKLFDREPPPVATLRSTADVFIVSDFQQHELFNELGLGGHQDRSRRWRQWLAMMRRQVPSVVFSSPIAGYYYSRVEVFDLNPATDSARLRATVSMLPLPVKVREVASGAAAQGADSPALGVADDLWQIETHGGSTANLEHAPTKPSQIHLSIDRLAAQVPWHVKVFQPGYEARSGQRYVLTLRARANRPRRMMCGFGQSHAPWQPLGLLQDIEVPTEWRSYEYPFVGTADDTSARIYCDVGSSDTSLELDAVALRDVTSGRVRVPEWR